MRMARVKTRDEILAAAARQFTHVGFKGASLQDIAAEVGCSKATLLYHFPGKDAILAEIMAPAGAELAKLIAHLDTLDDRAVQAAAIDGFVDLVLRYRSEAALIYGGSLDAIDLPAFDGMRPLTKSLCSAFAGRSAQPADLVAAAVILSGICGVVIDKDVDTVASMRSALIGVARTALIPR
jgi:AcrR family transcriptional regulator